MMDRPLCETVLRALTGDSVFRSVKSSPQEDEKKDEKYWNRYQQEKMMAYGRVLLRYRHLRRTVAHRYLANMALRAVTYGMGRVYNRLMDSWEPTSRQLEPINPAGRRGTTHFTVLQGCALTCRRRHKKRLIPRQVQPLRI